MAKAVAPAIAQQMRTRSSVAKQQGGAAAQSAANYAAAAMAARAAGTLIQSAREHLRKQMAELTALAADIAEDEDAAAAAAALAAAGAPGSAGAQQAQQQGGAAAGGPAGDGLSAEELAQIRRQVAQAGGMPGTADQLPTVEVTIAPAAQLKWTQGMVRCAWQGEDGCSALADGGSQSLVSSPVPLFSTP